VGPRAWKGFDWDILNLLYEKGWISDPRGKAKSVMLSEEGEQLAERFFKQYFEQLG
jgi:predicted transcriptional regulator